MQAEDDQGARTGVSPHGSVPPETTVVAIREHDIPSAITSARRPRGMQCLSPERRREISRLGGRAAQARGVAHRWTSAQASAAAQISVETRRHRFPGAGPRSVARAAYPLYAWELIDGAGGRLACIVHAVRGGFEVLVSYDDRPLMYSAIYADLGAAREMADHWYEAALAGANFTSAPARSASPTPG